MQVVEWATLNALLESPLATYAKLLSEILATTKYWPRMKKIKSSSLFTALALMVYPVLGIGSAARANTVSPPGQPPIELAQSNTQDCRVPNRLQDIYSAPSVDGNVSDVLETVQANTRFYLDRNPDGSLVQENGLIRGSIQDFDSSLTGWIITRYLTSIPGCGTSPPPENFCARARVDLSVRRDPAVRPNNVIGALNSGSVVTIRDESYDSATRRTWIQFPYTGGLGWAAETDGRGGRNFGARYRCDR